MQAMDINVSVIIPCLNCEGVISTQLSALERQACDRPWEIIVSDNGSKDETLKVVKTYQARMPHLRVVDSSARKGSGPARNIAVTQAKGDYIVFCDADDQVRPGWLQALIDALDTHEVVIGALDLLALNQSWRVPDHHHFGTKNSPQTGLLPYRHIAHLKHASAANMALHKDIHVQVGGFDESIMFTQDTDYCLRLQKLGHSLTFVPEAVVDYRLRHSLLGTYRQIYRWGKYSVLVYKNHLGNSDGIQQMRYLVGGWRYLPMKLLKIRKKSDVFKLVGWLGGRVGEVEGCLKYLIIPKLDITNLTLPRKSGHPRKADNEKAKALVNENMNQAEIGK